LGRPSVVAGGLTSRSCTYGREGINSFAYWHALQGIWPRCTATSVRVRCPKNKVCVETTDLCVRCTDPNQTLLAQHHGAG